MPEPVTGMSASAPKSPEPTPTAAATPPTPTTTPTTPAPAAKKEAAPASTSSVDADFVKANPSQVLLPSVLSLALNNNLTKEQVLADVVASGPNGRILKGDVLAFLGKISKSDVETVTRNIKNTQHLDLSNIKKATASRSTSTSASASDSKSAAKSDKKAAVEDKKKAPTPPVVLSDTILVADLVAFRTKLEQSVGSAPSIKVIVDKAAKLALKDVPAYSSPKKSVLNDEIFDYLVAPVNKGSPFDVSIQYPTGAAATSPLNIKKKDIFDILGAPAKPTLAGRSTVGVKLTVNPKYIGGDKKAKVYLERFNYYLSKEGLGELLV